MNNTEDLLEFIKGGSEEAYKLLFYNYYSDLVYYAVSIIHDTAIAEDIIQDFFVDLWTNKRFNTINKNLTSFLFRSVKNHCLNYIRDVERKNKHLSNYHFEVDTVESVVDLIDKKEIIYKAINQLPDKCKQIFILCCVHDYKYQEVAEDLDISINTVRTQMSRAFKKMRLSLSPSLFSSFLFSFYTRNKACC
ncbi:MAG: RNA polymerase sigma-70 factor [Marinifilaceae bacterium]